MNKVATILLATLASASMIASAAGSATIVKPRIDAKTGKTMEVVKPTLKTTQSGKIIESAKSADLSKATGKTAQANEFNAATCSAREFANELARRGNGDSAAIERQMKLIGVGMGMCSADTGGLLGKKEDGSANYTDAQLTNLVKILAQTEIEYAKNSSKGLLAAEEAAYANVMDQDNNITAEERATAKEAIKAFRTHCKIFANN